MSDRLAEGALSAYRGVGRWLMPAAGWLLTARTRRGKEDPARRGERLGHAALPRPNGDLIWVHAASVGETMSVLPVIAWLTGTGRRVLLTTGTVTSATIAATRLPAGAIHQYVPIDLAPAVARFLDHWQPSAAIFVESEIWPATILELCQRNIPRLLVNGRLSERSMSRWIKLGRMARSLFGRLTLVLAQSEEDGARFAEVGARDVRVTGNIKFDSAPLSADAAEVDRMRAEIGGRPVLVLASTHAGEEAIAAAAHPQLAAAVPGALTIVVPRHPVRSREVEDLLLAAGLSVAVRSRGEGLTAATDIYLADTLGELGLFFRLADVALVGGSLVPVGGHNPIEPAQLGTAILHGPFVYNARDIFARLEAVSGAQRVTDATDLAGAAIALLQDPARRMAMTAAATALVASGRGALTRTQAALADYLPCEVPSHVVPTTGGVA